MLRFVDLIVAVLGLALVAPILAFIALAVKLTSPGPALHRAWRVGHGERQFRLLKFRTMVANADLLGPAITAAGDRRITSVGRFLRRTKLDELPQLINVLRGEMSLVGPRPEDPRYVRRYTPAQRQVLTVRPGVTSPASIAYHAEESLLAGSDWEAVYVEHILPSKLAMDLEYLKHRTLWSDLGVITQTIVVILPCYQPSRRP